MMQKNVIWGLFSALILIGAGCAVEHEQASGRSQFEKTAMAEIDAAAGLMMESNRLDTLKMIAARPGLTADTQVYLVQVAVQKLLLESSRKTVFLALINNPTFFSEGKIAVLQHLDDLALESSRQEVLKQLDRRGQVPSGRSADDENGPPSKNDRPVKMKTTVEMTYSTGL